MSNVVTLPFRVCPSCRSLRHLRCRDWSNMIDGVEANCPCGCWDERSRQTKPWGHAQHADADPRGYARIMHAKLALQRTTICWHKGHVIRDGDLHAPLNW